MRFETIKILEEKTGSNFFDFSGSNFFLDVSPEARETKTKMNYWDFIKINSFCTARKQSIKLKGNVWDGGGKLHPGKTHSSSLHCHCCWREGGGALLISLSSLLLYE